MGASGGLAGHVGGSGSETPLGASGGFGGGGLPDILRIVLRVAKVSPLIKDLSDDPAVFSAVYDLEAGKTADINRTILMKTKLLAAQLSALHLQNGNTVVALLESALSK